MSTSNKTDSSGNITRRRLWTIPGHPEKALFGNYYDALGTMGRLRPIFRGDVRAPVVSPGIQPWGIANYCATDAFFSSPTRQGFKTLTASDPDFPAAGFGSLSGAANSKVSLWELEKALHKGVTDLKNGYDRFPASTPLLPPDQQQYCDVVAAFSSSCVGCHSGSSPSGGLDLSSDPAGQLINVNATGSNSTMPKRVVPNDPSQSELSRRVNLTASPGMPIGSNPFSQRGLIDAWITAGAPHTNSANCNTSNVPDVQPDEGLAFLTASNLVDGIWFATMGYRLTIDHGFPRNQDQRDMLWNLTEFNFLSNNWSLKSVLSKVLSSNWFARRAPSISQANTAYTLQPVLDPWIVADPTQISNPPAHQRANGQGELVDRFRVNTLLRNIAGTLGWKQPRLFPDGVYPSPLDQNLGQYLSSAVPGFRGVNFQSLLALEAEAGLCDKNGRAATATDWIDALASAIDTHNSANPAAPITIGEAWSLIKDRLIQDTSIQRALPSGLAPVVGAKTEEQALIDFWNQGASISGGVGLNTPTGAFAPAQLRTKLRAACGVLVKTPQFLLTNITPRTYSDNNMPDAPRLAVCLPGESCGYQSTCVIGDRPFIRWVTTLRARIEAFASRHFSSTFRWTVKL